DLYHDITIEKDIVNFDHFTMYDLENIMNRIELSKIKLIMVCTIEMLDLIIHDSTKKLTQSIKSKISMYELL
ncbi:MAG: hypothetical protein U9R16_04390, partial [Campylobacterota bacterium]|nr:hypothetical protein [Campylobacterota bacterium]